MVIRMWGSVQQSLLRMFRSCHDLGNSETLGCHERTDVVDTDIVVSFVVKTIKLKSTKRKRNLKSKKFCKLILFTII